MSTKPNTLKLKPRDGLTVRHPDTRRLLKVAGESVEMNSYWQRRINDGDVLPVPLVAVSTPKTTGGKKS